MWLPVYIWSSRCFKVLAGGIQVDLITSPPPCPLLLGGSTDVITSEPSAVMPGMAQLTLNTSFGIMIEGPSHYLIYL